MRYAIIKLENWLLRIIPAPIKSLFKFQSFNKLIYHFWNKYTAELAFQIEWIKKFKNNKSKVLEYWKEYRYLDKINTICKIENITKVLDVGCGINTVLHFIDGEKYGIDPLADEYKKLYDYPEEINIQKGLAENIHFPNEYFDVVFCSNVLDHVTNPQKTIDEVCRVLKKTKYFVLTLEIFKEKIKRDFAHPQCFIKKDVYQLLGSKFKTIFEKESPWIGIKNYVDGLRESYNKELIMILEKI